jgi:hypothetical protein
LQRPYKFFTDSKAMKPIGRLVSILARPPSAPVLSIPVDRKKAVVTRRRLLLPADVASTVTVTVIPDHTPAEFTSVKVRRPMVLAARADIYSTPNTCFFNTTKEGCRYGDRCRNIHDGRRLFETRPAPTLPPSPPSLPSPTMLPTRNIDKMTTADDPVDGDEMSFWLSTPAQTRALVQSMHGNTVFVTPF